MELSICPRLCINPAPSHSMAASVPSTGYASEIMAYYGAEHTMALLLHKRTVLQQVCTSAKAKKEAHTPLLSIVEVSNSKPQTLNMSKNPKMTDTLAAGPKNKNYAWGRPHLVHDTLQPSPRYAWKPPDPRGPEGTIALVCTHMAAVFSWNLPSRTNSLYTSPLAAYSRMR